LPYVELHSREPDLGDRLVARWIFGLDGSALDCRCLGSLKRDPTILAWLAAHGINVNTVTVIMFAALSIATAIVLVAFARTVTIVTELGPWQYEPRSVRVAIARVDFTRLAEEYTQPYIASSKHAAVRACGPRLGESAP